MVTEEEVRGECGCGVAVVSVSVARLWGRGAWQGWHDRGGAVWQGGGVAG